MLFVGHICSRSVIACLLFASNLEPVNAAEPDQHRSQEISEKVFCGYQGWFSAPGDGTSNGYDNYNYGGQFKPGTCVIDYWPDLTEFTAEEKFETVFRHRDGQVANVFSSANQLTVDRHFRWMREYGIDGIFLQRFGWALKNPQVLQHRNRVADNVKHSASKHGRLWALMYDLTSLKAGDIEEYIIPDIKRLAGGAALANDPSYARYRNKPIVAIWGVGFNDQRAYSLQECQKLIQFLKSPILGGSHAVMLGVPYYWREQIHDTIPDPLLHEVIKQADIISPWSVGRYRTVEDAERLDRHLDADRSWTDAYNLAYLPVIFPGFSWHNLSQAEGIQKPLNEIPRQSGKFLWSQARAVHRTGLDTLYVAMFDEMNEGTCIFKCTADPPVGSSPFLSYANDDLPSDYYLWLTGQISKLLTGKLNSTQQPERVPQ